MHPSLHDHDSSHRLTIARNRACSNLEHLRSDEKAGSPGFDIMIYQPHFFTIMQSWCCKGELAMNNITIGMDLGGKNNVFCLLDNVCRPVKEGG